MALPLFPSPASVATARRGRPSEADDPDTRALHLTVAIEWVRDGKPIKRLAAERDVNERTIRRWIRHGLQLDHPIAETLRRMAERN